MLTKPTILLTFGKTEHPKLSITSSLFYTETINSKRAFKNDKSVRKWNDIQLTCTIINKIAVDLKVFV